MYLEETHITFLAGKTRKVLPPVLTDAPSWKEKSTFRTQDAIMAWLYSEYGKNFVKTMLNLTATKPQLKVVFDQAGTPTYAYDLAKAIQTILQDYTAESPTSGYSKTGIYHFSNEGVCSWYDFTKAIAAMAGQTQCNIQPCHSNEFPSPVKRPAYSVLDKTKIKETFGIRIPYWTDSLKICIHHLKNA